jgi:predicted transcriptional regulator
MTTDAFTAALNVSAATASRRLTDAEAAGLLEREGKGGRSGPQVWREAQERLRDMNRALGPG